MITDNIIPEENLVNNTAVIFTRADEIFNASKAKRGVVVSLYDSNPELPAASETYLGKIGFGKDLHFLGTKKFGENYKSYFLCLNVKANQVTYSNVELINYLSKNTQDIQTIYMEKSLISILEKYYGKNCRPLFLGSYSNTVSVVVNDENLFNLNRINDLAFIVRPFVDLSDNVLTSLLNTTGIVGLCTF